jgi:putative SOS response-associated peptidase YedK
MFNGGLQEAGGPMCGRFQLSTDPREVLDALEVAINEIGDWEPRYNIAPTQTVPVVRLRKDQRTLSGAFWGLVPHWAQDTRGAFKMINARAETVSELRSFRGPVRKTRCVIPANGWYEWRAENGVKQPYHFQVDGIATFAGIWTWNAALALMSCSIITTNANPTAAEIHNRMPVVLPHHDLDRWLNPETELPDLLGLLRPYEGNDLRASRVSRYVSNARNEGPECIVPLS